MLACTGRIVCYKREWRLMLTLSWRESVNGIGIEYQKGMEVEWSEREEESGDGEV